MTVGFVNFFRGCQLDKQWSADIIKATIKQPYQEWRGDGPMKPGNLLEAVRCQFRRFVIER